ncbi:MAG: hypothetical protein ACKO1H_02005 [Tabrizicola sp.]
MRLFLVNDTGGSRHFGCKAVMRSLRHVLAEIPEIEIVGIHTVKERQLNEADFAAAEVVFVNGEGTIHHDGPRSLFLMGVIARARREGKRVVLANALFQMHAYADQRILEGLALLAVREPRSAAYARAYGGTPLVLLDSAADPRFTGGGEALALTSGTVIGGENADGPLPDAFAGLEGQRLTMFSAPMPDMIATLRQAQVYVTGQHHGVYAAALAGCPFVAVPSNSHKIEGFIEWTGLPIPICTRKRDLEGAIAFVKRNPAIFRDLTDFMAAQSVLTSAMLREALGLAPVSVG